MNEITAHWEYGDALAAANQRARDTSRRQQVRAQRLLPDLWIWIVEEVASLPPVYASFNVKDKMCGRIDKHPGHTWMGHKLWWCKGEVIVEGGAHAWAR